MIDAYSPKKHKGDSVVKNDEEYREIIRDGAEGGSIGVLHQGPIRLRLGLPTPGKVAGDKEPQSRPEKLRPFLGLR